MRGDSWNPQSDSPLAEPGLNVREGDVLAAIGGKKLDRAFGPNHALVNAAGREVSIVIRSGSQERHVTAKALASEQSLRYRAWVDAQRRYVHAATGEKRCV